MVYPKEYFDTHEKPITEHYPDDKYPDAMQRRNKRARELRKQGWTVKVGTADFQDLARATSYWLEAEKEKLDS